MATKKKTDLRDSVTLIAYNRRSAVVLDQTIDVHKYYDGRHPVIDSADFRRDRGIVRLSVIKHDFNGRAQETVELTYAANGQVISRRVVD